MFAARSGSAMMLLHGQYPSSERRRCWWWAVIAAAAFVVLWLAWPAPAAGQSSEADVRRVASQLRCVVCDHQSVAESNAELAAQMREVIREQLAGGRPRDHAVLRRAVRRHHPVRAAAPRLLATRLVGAGCRPARRRGRRSRLLAATPTLAAGAANPHAAALSPQEATPALPDLSDADIAYYRERLAQELAVEPSDPPDREH